MSRFPSSAKLFHWLTWSALMLGLMATANLHAADAPKPSATTVAVAAHLVAGEFGPAIDAALQTENPVERGVQLRQIAAAQRAVGEFDGAEATAGLIPNRQERARDRGQTARERGQGGSGADFTELMELIQATLEPESWDEVGGPGSVREFETGVRVDPLGQLRQVSKEELTGRLQLISSRGRVADLHEDMARQSRMRLISLPRLEQAVAARLREGKPIPETMRRLAGLSRIQYVFVYPDSNELVIAGPAEGWKYDDNGRPVSREAGTPMFDLDDLVTVLRTFSPGGQSIFGCSINPREANLQSVKSFAEASNAAGPLRPGQLTKWLKELHTRLGLQDVQVYGVPANSRVAQVLVEADYKMKLIGIDKLDSGVNIPSYFDLLKSSGNTGAASMDALRWWLTMKYGAIDHSPDRQSFEIRGSSVLCQSELQFVTSQGQHVAKGATEPTNQLFAQTFTKKYAELAKHDPVFADLQNLFDLGMAAALCQQEHLYERAHWKLGVFAANGEYQVAEVAAPKVVDSVINHRVYNGKDIVVQVAGGVRVDLLSVVKDKSLANESDTLSAISDKGKLPELPADRWWWDASR